VEYLLRAGFVQPEKQQLMGNGCVRYKNGIAVGSCSLRSPCQGCVNKDVQQLRKSPLKAVISVRRGIGVTWPPVCEGVSPGAEECQGLGAVIKQRTRDRG
jgi:hypothetical protein